MKINYPILILILLITYGIIYQFFYGFSWTITSGHAFASDDAFITYRYAQNIYLGNGAYFNISGEKVEGYSNFLYLLLLVPGFLFNSEYIYIYSTILNTFLLYFALFLFFQLLKKSFSKYYSLIGIGLVGLNPVVWANITTGLETILVLVIFSALWLILESKRTKLNLFFLFLVSAISMLARVDGFIFPIIVAIFLFFSNEKKLGVRLLGFSIVFMLIYALGRYIYYDDIIANTYYAKVSGNLIQRFLSGITYLYKQTFYNAIGFYFLFILIFIFTNIIHNKRKIVNFPIIFTAIWMTYLIYIGGDIYFERFLLPLLFIGIFYFLFFLQNKKYSIKIILIFIALVTSFSIINHDGRFKYEKKTYDMWVNLGKFLKQVPEEYILAIDASGKVPYYSKLKTLDMLGLNNKTIGKMSIKNRNFHAGHTKFDVDYILSLSPNLISAWISNSKDLGWGLTKIKYQDNYILKYLVNSTRKNKKVNIYNIEELDDIFIEFLIINGYNYGVLVRKDSLSDMPNLKLDKLNIIKKIIIGKKNYFNSESLIFKGWSLAEKTHRWSLGVNSEIYFNIDSNETMDGKLFLRISTLGKQEIKVELNNQLLGELKLNSRDTTLEVKFNPKILIRDDINILKFTYSNPHKAKTSSKRVIAMDFKYMIIK
jgi:hypothetical protein